MKAFDKRGIVKNVTSSWMGLAVNVITGFVVSPYILHKLGDDAFGLWVLVFAITGYYGLFDFGIRSSVVRYVAKFAATDDREELNRLINTSLFSYTCVGLLLLFVTAVGSLFVDSLFHIQPSFAGTARILFFMVGASLSLGFPLAVFGGTLEGLQKFYLLNAINITNTILRAVLIILALNRGYGLLMVALITVVLPLVNGAVNAVNAIRLTHLRVSRRFINKSTFKQIFHYGSVTFMISVAGKLRFKSDALVIGTFLSSSAITYFAIGSRLVDYAGEVVAALAQIFVPMSSHSDAKGDMGSLRKLFVAGNRACAFLIFPVAAVLVILGKSVIEVWVGKKYIAQSYPVLLILLFPSTLMLAQAASGRILYGMAKHGTWAKVVLAEGIANVVLSVILVRRFGIIGDAVGTAIPLSCSMLLFLPQQLCRLLDIPIRTYVARAFLLPLALCVPLVLTLIAMQRWFVPHTYFQLGFQLLVGGLVYGAGILWAVKTGRAWEVGEFRQDEASTDAGTAMVETFQEEV
jgi:O-antigen/teichoic acid export membrane protein